MNLLNDINEARKNADNMFMVTGTDNTIQSIWYNDKDADTECKKRNKEIGGTFFSVKPVKSTEIMD